MAYFQGRLCFIHAIFRHSLGGGVLSSPYGLYLVSSRRLHVAQDRPGSPTQILWVSSSFQWSVVLSSRYTVCPSPSVRMTCPFAGMRLSRAQMTLHSDYSRTGQVQTCDGGATWLLTQLCAPRESARYNYPSVRADGGGYTNSVPMKFGGEARLFTTGKK